MADEISIGKQAIKEVQDLRAELVKLSEDALKAGKNLSSISTPSGLNKNGADNAKTGAEIDALKAKYIALNDAIVKKAEQSRLAEIRLQQQREKAFDSFEKNAKKEQDLLNKNSNAYNKTQTQITNLTKVYNDLAVRKARYNDLSEHEENRLVTLAKVNEKYNGLLKGTDAVIGKNIRNVGNYGNSYNALGNSINQLSREAPAFANSINTGFMALSNNFPALFDAIKGIREQNKLLVAEGKPTTSLFSQLASGIFSWQTALSVGVTLLTIYGGQFVKWIQEMTKGKETISELKLRIDTLNKSFEDTNVASAVKNVNELAVNIDLAKKGFLDKEKVVEQYNETIGKTTGLVSTLDEAEKELTANGDAYIKMTLYKAAANIALEEASRQVLEAEKSRRKSLEDFSNAFLDADLTQTRSKEQYNAKQANLQRQREKRQKEEVKINEDAAKANINIAKKFQEDAAKIASNFGFNFFGDTKKEKEKKVKKEDTTPKIKELESSLKSVGTIITQVNEEISKLLTEKILANEDELPAVNFQLEQLIKLKNQLEGMPEVDLKIVNTAVKSKEAVKQLSEEMKGYLKSFSSELFSNSGFSETFKMLNNEIDGFGENWQITAIAIMESAQEMFNFITNASQQNFAGEKERLQNQYDVSLKYTGDNKAAQEKLAEDLEKKKKDIAYREAKAKQKQAIFNIAIDTAQAIIGLWANPGFPAAIPLAIGVGVLGAAQIAMVSSQKIPQYWMGGTHDGGLMMVNDGAGSNFKETIVTPDGKIMQPQGRNVIMDAPAGTEIFTQSQWNDTLNDMLQGKGISMSNNYQSSGMTASQMDAVMSKHFSKIQVNNTTFDKNGIRSWSDKNGNKTINSNARGSGTGFKI
jgi:hypothetical protein